MKIMKHLKNSILGIAFIFFFAGPVVALATPVSVQAFDSDESCESRAFLGLPNWYRGLSVKDDAGNCGIASPSDLDGGLASFIWKIALNIIEIGVIIAGYVALFIVLYSGFLFLTGGSNPGQVEKARVGIINAVIGLAIALGAVALVNLIFRITG